MMQSFRLCVFFVLIATFAMGATIYDTSLVSPPGFYAGSGNPNSDFAVGTFGNLELGLAVNERYVGPINPAGGNVYQVDPGAGAGGWSKGGIHWSVNTQVGGGSDTLDDYTYVLQAFDVTAGGVGFAFDPVRLTPDNSCWNGSEVAGPCSLSTQWGAQNTSNLSWILPGFNVNDESLYRIKLSAFNLQGQLVGDVTVYQRVGDAPAVPEPSTYLLTSFVLLGLAAAKRKFVRR
jgi:hypothetical protein